MKSSSFVSPRKTTPKSRMIQPLYKLPVYELLDEEGIERLHEASMEILQEIGIDFYDTQALALLKQNGARVKDRTVFFDRELVQEYLAKAPAEFTQLARNADNNLQIGGKHLCFAPIYGPPFVYDIENGRRPASLADFENFVKLAYLCPYMHHSGGTLVEPNDAAIETRHLDMLLSHILFSDKAFMGSVTSAENAADSVAMAEILFGEEKIRQQPALLSLINISSPRCIDERMLGALTVYARARQAVMITPFILAGTTAPASIAATIAQQNAEALAVIVYTQMVSAGAPVIYGSFMTNIDLRTGAPVFGSPESQLAIIANAQLARRYRLPFRSGGMYASAKLPDAQAAYESIMTMLPAIQSHVNFILHAAGWLENGLVAGYEKFVLDCEILGMFHKYLQGLDLSDEALAMESIRTVPPGGHHLGTDHTYRNFRTAFYHAELFDYNDFEEWQKLGAPDTLTRANQKYKQLLDIYQRPPLDPAIEDALRAFIDRRKTELAHSPSG